MGRLVCILAMILIAFVSLGFLKNKDNFMKMGNVPPKTRGDKICRNIFIECKILPVIVDSNVFVDISFKNLFNEELKVEEWRVLLEEEMRWDAFRVFRGKEAVPYLGKFASRPWPPRPESFYTIPIGGTLATRVPLSENYDCSVPGNYTLWYDGVWFIRDPNDVNEIRFAFDVTSNKAEFNVKKNK